MLNVMALRAANRLVDITEDPDIRALKAGRDWPSFLSFLIGLFEMLMPIFDKCMLSSEMLIDRARAWGDVIHLGRRARRQKLGIMENFLLSRWERQVGRGIDEDIGDELNNEELIDAMLYTIANSTPSEIDDLRAESARLGEVPA